MKQTFKRLQALALVLAMCVSFLQIPSFAAESHANSYTLEVQSVEVKEDGSFSIIERCAKHANVSGADCENTVTGQIVKQADGSYAIDAAKVKGISTKDDVTAAVTTDNLSGSAKVEVAGCTTPATIQYTVKVGNVNSWSSKAVETAPATGKHTAVTEAEQKMTFAELSKNTTEWQLVEGSDTATCKGAGKATFAKKCDDCGKFVNTVEVTSPMSYHKFIQNEKKENQVFEEEITATSCAKAGTAYHYIQCKDCGQKFYFTKTENPETQANGGYCETATVYAEEFPIEALPHTFEYALKVNNNIGAVTKTTTDANLNAAFVVESKCTVDGKSEDEQAKVTKVVEDKTQLVEPNKCKAGSRTFTVTYTVTDYSKKAVNGYGTKEVTEVVTVPYYAKSADVGAHDFGTQVTDEETAVKATCCENGHYDQVQICKVCGEKKLISTHTLFATGKHTAADAVKENVVAATYAKAGSYDLVTRCADCGEVLSSTHKTVAKLTVNKSSISKVKNVKTKKAQVTIKKASSVTGYQIQYSTSSKYKSGNKSVKTKKTSYTIKNLKKGKKYYVRVRSYKTVDGKTYYSSWSGSKTVTIKK